MSVLVALSVVGEAKRSNGYESFEEEVLRLVTFIGSLVGSKNTFLIV